MRPVWIFLAASLALDAGTGAAQAFSLPDSSHYPSDNEIALKLAANRAQPYPMNYADEAAQTLGVKDGRWDAFATHSSDPLMPSLKGGIVDGAAMLRLQWRPGG